MGSFWRELKRRNVVKVGVAYAIVAWVLVEIVATIEAPLGLPDWVDTLVIVLLAVGFPIALILSWAYDLTPEGVRGASADGPSTDVAHVAGQRFNYVVVGLLALTLAFLVFDRFILAPGVSTTGTERPIATSAADGTGSGPSPTVQRLSLDIGPATTLGFGSELTAQLALSPDGTRLAYATLMRGDDLNRIYLRPLAQLDAPPVAGAEESDQPFFSPDGERLAFFSGDLGLAWVSVGGGAPESLMPESYFNDGDPSGGTWLADDTIVFSKGGRPNGQSLFRVAVSGGSPEALLPATDQELYTAPAALPGGEAILLTIRLRRRGSGSTRDTSIAALSLASGDLRTLIGPGYRPRYVPSGHVVFIRDGALWAVPFDADRLEITGPAVEVVRGVQHDSSSRGGSGEAAYTVSDNGLLIYAPGGDVGIIAGRRLKRLVRVDRQGNEQPLAAEPRDYHHPRLSPDGASLAVTIPVPDDQEGIWIYDLARDDTPSRLTRDSDNRPLWTPDGERVVFRSNCEGARVCWAAADGSGAVTPLSEWGTQADFTPNGTGLVIYGTGEFEGQLRLLSMDGSGASELLLDDWSAGYNESLIEISPHGDWMAYTSELTGREEIYVRPFPNVEGGVWRISTNGGFEPRWSPDGGRLFYRNGSAMMSVSIETDETGSAFSPGLPDELFSGPYAGVDPLETAVARPSYDVSPDGRFLMLSYADPPEPESGSTQLVVVNNWFEELRRLAPPGE